jgi:hypothetical protein
MGILSTVRDSVSASIYMPDDELTVYAAGIVAAHAVGLADRAARIMLSSEQGGFGKSQALQLVSYTTPNPWLISGKSVSGPAIRSHLMRPERPTVILDEAAKVFGKSGREGSGSPLYTMLCDGYGKDAVVTVSANGIDEESSSYCMMFIGGLGTSLPEDALSRTIRLKMVKRPKHITLTPVSARKQALEWLRDPIAGWVAGNEDYIRDALSRLPSVHEELVDRTGEIWGLLFAVAMADDPDETERMIKAFKRLGLDKPTETHTMDERLIEATLNLCGDDSVIFSRDVAAMASAWVEFGGKTPRQVAMDLAAMLGSPDVVELNNVRARGWRKSTLEFALSRFTVSVPMEPIPDIYDEMLAVPEGKDTVNTQVLANTEITQVTEVSGGLARL